MAGSNAALERRCRAQQATLKSVRARADSSTTADGLVRQRVDGNRTWARDEVVLLGTIALPGEDRVHRLLGVADDLFGLLQADSLDGTDVIEVRAETTR